MRRSRIEKTGNLQLEEFTRRLPEAGSFFVCTEGRPLIGRNGFRRRLVKFGSS